MKLQRVKLWTYAEAELDACIGDLQLYARCLSKVQEDSMLRELFWRPASKPDSFFAVPLLFTNYREGRALFRAPLFTSLASTRMGNSDFASPYSGALTTLLAF